MTIGPDNFGNGVPKNEDRFATQLGQYRAGSRRESGRTITGDASGSELSQRTNAGTLDGRNGSSVLDGRTGTAQLEGAPPIASSIAAAKLADSGLLDGNPLLNQANGREPWVDAGRESLVDHPMLRGLLMELPPKGAVPEPEYLDRWFEAARSILDLLYAMSARS